MKLEVLDYQEDSNGGGTVTLDLDIEARQLLIERGFNSMIKNAIENFELEEVVNKPTMQEKVIEHNRKHKEFLEEYQKWVQDQKYIDDQES